MGLGYLRGGAVLGGTTPRLIARDAFTARVEREGALVGDYRARLAPLGFSAARAASPTASAAATGIVILFDPGLDIRREDRITEVATALRTGATPRSGNYGTGFKVQHVEVWDGCTLVEATAEE